MMYGGLHVFHGPFSATLGTIVGPILQCYLIAPKSFSRKTLKKIMLVTICSVLVPILFQGFFLILVMHLYVASGSNALVILLFPIIRIIFDLCVGKLCRVSETSSLCIILINTNALTQRMFLCWALTKASNINSILLAVAIDFSVALRFLIIVYGPLTI